jgi:hypothetical protein
MIMLLPLYLRIYRMYGLYQRVIFIPIAHKSSGVDGLGTSK